MGANLEDIMRDDATDLKPHCHFSVAHALNVDEVGQVDGVRVGFLDDIMA